MDATLICFTTVVFAFVFGFVVVARYIGYRETVVLAERGLLRPKAADRNGRALLAWGTVLTFLGLATLCGLYPLGWIAAPGEFPFNFGPWMLVGLLPTAFGLALLTIYTLQHRGSAVPPAEVPSPPEPGSAAFADGSASWTPEYDVPSPGPAPDAGTPDEPSA